MHILQDSFCLQYHSQECSIIIKEKQWVYITAQAWISHLFLMPQSIPPTPGLASHCWDKSAVHKAVPLHWTPGIKRKTKPSVLLPTAWKEVHIWPNTVHFYADAVKTKNIFLQWAEWSGFFPFMFGGSKHSILPPSKLLRCEFLSARAVSSICNTWSVVGSHDHGL